MGVGSVGAAVGMGVGTAVGAAVGMGVGATVGTAVGFGVGALVSPVGAGVGAIVNVNCRSSAPSSARRRAAITVPSVAGHVDSQAIWHVVVTGAL